MDNSSEQTSLVHVWDNLGDLEAVRIFAAVAELRSFRSAAESIGVPRSTVSRAVALLEEKLGQRLLQRTTRVVTLTEAGDSYLRQVAPALHALADATQSILDAQAEPRGLLKVTASPALAERLLAPLVCDFLTAYPQVRLEMMLTDRWVDLVAEGVDVAFRAGPLPDSSLVARSLGGRRARCFASTAYLKVRGTPLAPTDLTNHDCLVFSGSRRGALWPFLVGKKAVDVKVHGRLTVNSMLVARDAAIAGLGIVRLPDALGGAKSQLVEVLADFVPPPVPLHVVYPSSRQLSPRVRTFVDFVTEHLAPLQDCPLSDAPRARTTRARV